MPSELTTDILEETSAIYTATVKDEAGTGIPLANFISLVLTFYDLETGDIINSRNGQNILNANNVVVTTTGGQLTWTMQPGDNAIVTASRAREKHRALFEWTYNSTLKGKDTTTFTVVNLNKVP